MNILGIHHEKFYVSVQIFEPIILSLVMECLLLTTASQVSRTIYKFITVKMVMSRDGHVSPANNMAPYAPA